jgi:hypothetical protein
MLTLNDIFIFKDGIKKLNEPLGRLQNVELFKFPIQVCYNLRCGDDVGEIDLTF